MKGFSGFPARTKYTPIPNQFFSMVLPEIQNLSELRVTLHIFWSVYQKHGYPRFVSYHELSNDTLLTKGLQNDGSPHEILQRSLDQAVSRGTVLRLTMERDGNIDDLYFLNTEADSRAVEKIKSGELHLGDLIRLEPHPPEQEQRPNIFVLYEQNIGMLSPIIAEELKEAEKTYPASWIEDAFREAVDLNKRSWRYISRTLERWSAGGKKDGEYRRHSKTVTDPEEYRRRYGHLLKR